MRITSFRYWSKSTTLTKLYWNFMPLQYHPKTGTIVICDYNSGFVPPEMVKRRPAIVVFPQFKKRSGLCTIVPFSTTPPTPVMPYHYKLNLNPTLPSTPLTITQANGWRLICWRQYHLKDSPSLAQVRDQVVKGSISKWLLTAMILTQYKNACLCYRFKLLDSIPMRC